MRNDRAELPEHILTLAATNPAAIPDRRARYATCLMRAITMVRWGSAGRCRELRARFFDQKENSGRARSWALSVRRSELREAARAPA